MSVDRPSVGQIYIHRLAVLRARHRLLDGVNHGRSEKMIALLQKRLDKALVKLGNVEFIYERNVGPLPK